MQVSVVIPFKDQAPRLADLLDRLSRQSYPADQIELIAIEHGEVESAGSLKKRYPHVRWLFEPGRSSSVARNLAVVQAHGDVLAFTEADCLPDEDWIRSGVEALTSSGAADAIAGRISLQFEHSAPSSLLEWYQYCINSRQEDNVERDHFGSAANLFVFAKTFETIGFFDSRFQVIGDQHWGQTAFRAGHVIAYAADAMVSRRAAQSWRKLGSQAKNAARETMVRDSKNDVSAAGFAWRTLLLFLPDISVAGRALKRGGRWSLLRLPGVFLADWMLRVIAGFERVRTGARDLGLDLKRAARNLAPWPRMWAHVSGSQVPRAYITGRKSGLVRPESISFTSSGDLLGVCNSEGHSVGIFERVGGVDGFTYKSEPSRIVSNADILNYVHDAILSPCGSFVVTVARDAHAFSLFDGLGDSQPETEETPLWTFQGEASSLNLPTGAAIHPSGDFIAVANRRQEGITVYRRQNDSLQFDPAPIHKITEAEMFEHGLSAPHGVDFSPDGNFLAVSHKQFRKWGNVGGGESAVAIYHWRQGTEPGLDPVPAAMRTYGADELHSISVHPDGDLIAVTDEAFGVIILRFQHGRSELDEVARFPVFRVGAGIKGLGFTRNGKQLAVTCDVDEILFFDLPEG